MTSRSYRSVNSLHSLPKSCVLPRHNDNACCIIKKTVHRSTPPSILTSSNAMKNPVTPILSRCHVASSVFPNSPVSPRDPLLSLPSSPAGDIALHEYPPSASFADMQSFARPFSRTNQIPVLKIEAIQFVTRLLRIHDILVDDECRAFGIIRHALPYLSAIHIRDLRQQKVQSLWRSS